MYKPGFIVGGWMLGFDGHVLNIAFYPDSAGAFRSTDNPGSAGSLAGDPAGTADHIIFKVSYLQQF
jgi:hypothetical protein